MIALYEDATEISICFRPLTANLSTWQAMQGEQTRQGRVSKETVISKYQGYIIY